jgi:5'-nucleotidase
MRILITNDDGLYAQGIHAIAKELSSKHTVTIIAPEGQRSACGHAITMHMPLFLKKIDIDGLIGIECYMTNGTPADCVKLGIGKVMAQPPDIVVSGINNGKNIGTDVLYSGTVSGALEGAILGMRSFALSIDSDTPKYYHDAARLFSTLLDTMDMMKYPLDRVLNINFPDKQINDIKGIVAAHQGITRYTGEFSERSHPRGYTYYWLSGELDVQCKNAPDTDVKLLSEGYAVITPLKFDLTDEALLKILNDDLKNTHYR